MEREPAMVNNPIGISLQLTSHCHVEKTREESRINYHRIFKDLFEEIESLGFNA
jgi:hypothetical protein